MRKDKSQIFIQRIIFSVPFLVLLFIICLIFFISTARIYFQSRKISLERRGKEILLQAEKEKNKKIEEQITKLRTPEGMEKILRKNFQIKKPGEKVIVILDPEKPKNDASNQNGGGLWSAVLNWWLKK